MKCAISIFEDRLKVVSGYSPILVERFRAIPGAKPHYLDGKFAFWTFPIMPDTVMLITDVCGILPSMLNADVRAVIASHIKTPEAKRTVDLSVINGHTFKTQPYDHQRINLARAMTFSRWLFADEAGTGKSMPMCNRIAMIRDEKILIICPRSVCLGWIEQLKIHADMEATIITGNPVAKQKKLRESGNIVIAGYETVLSMESNFLAIAWDAMILDEVQKVKNFTAKVSKCIRKISEKTCRVWGLSGTPACNGMEDWLGVVSAIDPALLPVKTKTAFEARYCFKARVGGDGPFTIAGYRNVEELHGYVSSISSRVTKKEALDLPDKVISTRYVDMDGDQKRVYRELKNDAVARINHLKEEGQLTARNILSEQLRLLQIVGGFVPSDDGKIFEFPDKCKIPAIRDLIDEVSDKQVVIWAAFVAEAEFLAKWLKNEYGGGVATLTGKMNDTDRNLNVDSFKRGDARWFVGMAGSGGVGINGLQVCDTEFYYSRNFRMDYWKQSQDRCHRLGVKNTVSVVKIICQGSVDIRVDERLDEKDAQMNMMLDNAEDVL